jgi:hypothetical protein
MVSFKDFFWGTFFKRFSIHFLKEQHKTECFIIRLDAGQEALKQITKKRSQKAKNILKMVKNYNTYDKFTFLLNMSQNMGEHDNKIQW